MEGPYFSHPGCWLYFSFWTNGWFAHFARYAQWPVVRQQWHRNTGSCSRAGSINGHGGCLDVAAVWHRRDPFAAQRTRSLITLFFFFFLTGLSFDRPVFFSQ